MLCKRHCLGNEKTTTDQEKKIAKYTSDKRLLSNIYKGLLKLNNKKNSNIKMGDS